MKLFGFCSAFVSAAAAAAILDRTHPPTIIVSSWTNAWYGVVFSWVGNLGIDCTQLTLRALYLHSTKDSFWKRMTQISEIGHLSVMAGLPQEHSFFQLSKNG